MEEVHQRVFPGVPIVFCLPNGVVPGAPALNSDFTGVENDMAPAETVQVGLQLQPGTKNVVVVGGVAPFDREGLAAVKKALKPYEGRLDISYPTDLPVPDLLKRLQQLPNHTLVLLTSVGQDAAGTSFKANQIGPLVAAAANAPVFGLFDVYLNHGEVGGYLSNLNEQGKVAGGMALRLLKGDKPRDIPMVKGVNTYMFDWRAIKRWGLKESNLPPGSIVLNRRFTVWEAYWSYIIGGIALILAETVLIFALFWQWAKRRRSERYSRELVLRSPVAMVVTRRPGHKNELVNRKFTELFGYTIEDVPDEEHWWPLAYPNKAYREAIKAEWRRRVERASIEEGDIDPMEASVRCKDGSHRHIEFHFARSGDSHLVSFVDLTDRRRAEIQLRESEERFRLVANEAPVLIWMCGPDRLCNYFNKPWLEFTGRAVQAELGDGWVEGVHPDDLNRCLQIYIEAFDRREPFEMQYRLRRHDGEYRWILDKGVPRFNPDGTFAGYIGSCIDITDRKLAEEAMSTIGRRLIEAQEEERAWIGRELHDDINQRLALLAVELDRWSQHIPSTPELSGQIRHTQQRIMQISKDVQGLSHRLHSSKLEYLGLATAANSFCKELAGQSKVDVQFSHAGIPRSVPKEVSLCLFRVLQEALQNAVKHSGVRSFTVDLNGTEEAIELTVSDIGRGFEEQDAFTREGLGLISMRERVQLVHGELSVKSKTGAGTTIHARVPLITHEYRAVAV
jgi:PAS domain S-box-containing protein